MGVNEEREGDEDVGVSVILLTLLLARGLTSSEAPGSTVSLPLPIVVYNEWIKVESLSENFQTFISPTP